MITATLLALANSMWLGVAALTVAVISVTLLREVPLRRQLAETEALGDRLPGRRLTCTFGEDLGRPDARPLASWKETEDHRPVHGELNDDDRH